MVSFMETRLPDFLALSATGGPEFSTSIVSLQSGHEQRNSNWSTARARYNIASGVRTREDFEALLAFFRVVKGRATGFRFRDGSDYQGAGEVIGVGTGAQVSFQLIKRYTAGSTTVTRTIAKPVSGTVAVYKNSVLQTSGVSVNTATGMVTFTTAPASGVVVSADFEFDVPVRFDTDSFDPSLAIDGSGKWEIHVIELRV